MKGVNEMGNASSVLLKSDPSPVRMNPFSASDALSEIARVGASETEHRSDPLSVLLTVVSQKKNGSGGGAEKRGEKVLPAQAEQILAFQAFLPTMPVSDSNLLKANPGKLFVHTGSATSLAETVTHHSVSNAVESGKRMTLLMHSLFDQANREVPALTPLQQSREMLINAQQSGVTLIARQQHEPQIKAADKPTFSARYKNVAHQIVESAQHLQRKEALDVSPKEPVTLTHSANKLSLPLTHRIDLGSQDWSHQLYSALKDRIQFQLDNSQQVATLRLDPPTLGKIDIAIQLDAGKLVVHINAAQGDVFRSLQQISDTLRQHLTEQNFVQVDVHVSTGSHQHQQQGQQEKTVNYALEIAAEENVFTNDDNIITKV
jgi:type III secretion system needle length determinant